MKADFRLLCQRNCSFFNLSQLFGLTFGKISFFVWICFQIEQLDHRPLLAVLFELLGLAPDQFEVAATEADLEGLALVVKVDVDHGLVPDLLVPYEQGPDVHTVHRPGLRDSGK